MSSGNKKMNKTEKKRDVDILNEILDGFGFDDSHFEHAEMILTAKIKTIQARINQDEDAKSINEKIRVVEGLEQDIKDVLASSTEERRISIIITNYILDMTIANICKEV